MDIVVVGFWYEFRIVCVAEKLNLGSGSTLEALYADK